MIEFQSTKEKSENVYTGDGGIDFEKAVFVQKNRGTIIKGYFLSFYNEDTDIDSKTEIYNSYSVKGRQQKVQSAKALTKYNDKKTGAEKYCFDFNEKDILADEMEASKKASSTNMATINIRSTEIYVPFFCTYASIIKDVIGEDKKPTGEKELMEYTPNKAICVIMPVGDLFFPSAASGVGRKFNELFEAADLEDNRIKFSYAELIVDFELIEKTVKGKTKKDKINFTIDNETEEIQNAIAELRENQVDLKEQFKHLYPIPYKIWYEETQGKKYYTNSELYFAEKKNQQLDFSLPGKNPAKTESAKNTTEDENDESGLPINPPWDDN